MFFSLLPAALINIPMSSNPRIYCYVFCECFRNDLILGVPLAYVALSLFFSGRSGFLYH